MGLITRAPSDLLRAGPLLDCEVSVSTARRAWLTTHGLRVHGAISVTALLDTGSTVSALGSRSIQRLGLDHVGDVSIFTPTGAAAHPTRQYEVDLAFPGGQIVYDLLVVEASLEAQGIDLLVGRDVLMHAVLVYLGTENQFTLAF